MQVIITEKNFDSSFRGDYKAYHIDNRLISQPQINSPIFIKLNNYLQMPLKKIINPLTLALEIHDSISFLNKQIEKVYRQDYIIKQGKFIDNLFEINIEKEIIIHIIKRIIDDIIMLLGVFHDSNEMTANPKFKISSFGQLKSQNTSLTNLIKADINYNKYENILTTINDLHNAYKHSCLINQSRQLFSPTCVAFSAYYAKDNDLNKLYYLNHNAMHVIIGFSDFLLEFFDVEQSNKQYSILKTKNTIAI